MPVGQVCCHYGLTDGCLGRLPMISPMARLVLKIFRLEPLWLGLYLESFQWRHLVAPMARLVLRIFLKETIRCPYDQVCCP